MHGAESVGNKDVSHVSQGFCKCGVILGLALVKTKVLEEEDLAGLQSCCLSLCIGADGVGSEDHIHAEQLAEAFCYRSEGQLAEGLLPGFTGDVGFILALFYLLFHIAFKGGSRLAQVGAGDDGSAVVKKLADGGKSGFDTLVAGDFTGHFVLGNVEVTAEKNFLSGYINIIDGFLVVIHLHILRFKLFKLFYLPWSRSSSGLQSPADAALRKQGLPRNWRG